MNIFLILLNTETNWKVVKEFMFNFKSAFSFTNKIYKRDILSKTKDPTGPDFSCQSKNVRLVFFDPLKVRQVEVNENNINNEKMPFYRIQAFQVIENWYDSTEKLQSDLQYIKPIYRNPNEFLEKYKRYINS